MPFLLCNQDFNTIKNNYQQFKTYHKNPPNHMEFTQQTRVHSIRKKLTKIIKKKTYIEM